MKFDGKSILFSLIKSGYNVVVDSKFDGETPMLGFKLVPRICKFADQVSQRSKGCKGHVSSRRRQNWTSKEMLQ